MHSHIMLQSCLKGISLGSLLLVGNDPEGTSSNKKQKALAFASPPKGMHTSLLLVHLAYMPVLCCC
jgi:hypothetical protein